VTTNPSPPASLRSHARAGSRLTQIRGMHCISTELRYAMLCYAMICCATLCCAMLCSAVLCYAMLCYALLCYALTRRYQPMSTTGIFTARGPGSGSWYMVNGSWYVVHNECLQGQIQVSPQALSTAVSGVLKQPSGVDGVLTKWLSVGLAQSEKP
jgi:hypothetical protein